MTLVLDVATAAFFVAFVSSGFLVLGALLALPGIRRFETIKFQELVRINPEAAFYVILARNTSRFVVAALVSGTCLAVLLGLRTIL